jgi:hypothetical protein
VTAAVDLPKLYRRAINLWVEDTLTSEYLQDIWGIADLLCLISGSTDSVGPAVRDAQRNGMANVFGVVDRDFYETNYADWANAKVRYFVLPVHEIENYLLDPIALAGCDTNNNVRTESQISTYMHTRAGELLWWMACRHTIKQVRRMCWDDFIPVPRVPDITGLQSACDHITNTNWYTSFAENAGQITTPAQIEVWVNEAAAAYAADLDTGEWRRSFAGKELFRHARGYIYQPPQPASSLTYDIDVAKSLAKWQVDNGQVPRELTTLLSEMQRKV